MLGLAGISRRVISTCRPKFDGADNSFATFVVSIFFANFYRIWKKYEKFRKSANFFSSYVEFTCYKLTIFAEPDDICFGFSIGDFASQFHFLVFSNIHSTTGLMTDNLNGFGRKQNMQMRGFPDRPIIAGRSHLALIICIILQGHICNLQIVFASFFISNSGVSGVSRDSTRIT